ncbi:MAG: AAA family ATPase [bacterium]|nr:AAA family ATPase [bacterium]
MSKTLSGPWLPTIEEAEKFLRKHIVGQEEAISAVLDQYGNFRSGFKDITENTRRKPIGVFLFLGPSQVGKTEVGRILGKLFYGTPDAITKLSMETYNQAHFVSKLIGSPQGYIGYEDPPALSKQNLYSKIPGRKEKRIGKNATRSIKERSPDHQEELSPIEFLTGQHLMLSLEKGGFELALRELQLLDRTIAHFQDQIRKIEEAEKQGKLSRESELLKVQIRERIQIVTTKRNILFLEFYNEMLGEIIGENEEKAEEPQENPSTAPSLDAVTALRTLVEPNSSQEEEPILIIVLDEIEKAHFQIWNFFLQVFQEGIAQMANGEETNLRKAIFVITSNLGAKSISPILRNKNKAIGFRPCSNKTEDIRLAIKKELERTFPQEFLNRIDAIVTFNDLSEKDLRDILDMQIDEVILGLEAKLIGLEIDPEARGYIIAKARQFPEEQAEGVSKQLKILVTTPLRKFFDQEKIRPGQTITVTVKENKIVFILRVKKQKPAA